MISDYQRGVVTTAEPVTPLFIPKAVVALGFTLLVITAAQMMLLMIAERWLPRVHKAMSGGEIEGLAVIEREGSP